MTLATPFTGKRRFHLGLSTLLCAATFTVPALAQTSGANGTHDPSRMMESEGKVYVYSTGGGSKYSSDGFVWTAGPRMQPDGWPAWVNALVSNTQGLWAPDGMFYNGKYFLFYSGCASNGNCFTGVQTSPTLNPESASYKWTDQGKIASNTTSDNFAPIDPAPFVDATGNFWVVFGGGFANPNDANAIFVVQLDKTTGLPLSGEPKPGRPVLKGHKEGAYIHYRSGYYYLFWNTGGCCSGTSSTYTIHVSRAQAPTGPFTEDRTFYATNAGLNIHGPGHMGIYACGDVERFTYHYYPSNGSVLGENDLTWGSDGWPKAGAVSTKPLKLPCTAAGETAIKGARDMDRSILVRKSSRGYRMFIPESRAGRFAELLDVHGKRLATLQTTKGWNEISEGVLQSGVNVIRFVSDRESSTALLISDR